MKIDNTETASGGSYTYGEEGQQAVMTYSRASPKLIIIDHTEVPDIYRGQGVGQALAEHAVMEARKGGWKVIALCPFFKAQLQRHPEWRDIEQG